MERKALPTRGAQRRLGAGSGGRRGVMVGLVGGCGSEGGGGGTLRGPRKKGRDLGFNFGKKVRRAKYSLELT